MTLKDLEDFDWEGCFMAIVVYAFPALIILALLARVAWDIITGK
jgi:hypothetical protein